MNQAWGRPALKHCGVLPALALALQLGCSSTPEIAIAGDAVDAGKPADGKEVHAVGDHLEDDGQVVRLIGWNRPGAEYFCLSSRSGAFDGRTDLASIQAMQAWRGFNTVRLPLNETCWLGINGVSPGSSGDNYINELAAYVSLFRQNGIFVVLDLHWNAPGTFLGQGQLPMADADHALDFWTQVATKFQGDQGVIFDLYNEPHPDSVPAGGFVAGTDSADPWSCWLNGGCTITPQPWEQNTGSYLATGMQPMLDAVRATGAKNLVLASGVEWAGDLSGWLAHAPTDPENNVAASGHSYFKPLFCTGADCYSSLSDFSSTAQVPLVAGEFGEFDCAHKDIDPFMNWADAHDVSYLAWSWSQEDCGSPDYTQGPSLIIDWSGTPTAYGQGFKDHLSTLPP